MHSVKILCFHLVCSDEYIILSFIFKKDSIISKYIFEFTVVVIFINSLFDKHYCGCPHSLP